MGSSERSGQRELHYAMDTGDDVIFLSRREEALTLTPFLTPFSDLVLRLLGFARKSYKM